MSGLSPHASSGHTLRLGRSLQKHYSRRNAVPFRTLLLPVIYNGTTLQRSRHCLYGVTTCHSVPTSAGFLAPTSPPSCCGACLGPEPLAVGFSVADSMLGPGAVAAPCSESATVTSATGFTTCGRTLQTSFSCQASQDRTLTRSKNIQDDNMHCMDAMELVLYSRTLRHVPLGVMSGMRG